MSYPQTAQSSGTMNQLTQPPPPPESVTQVLDQTQTQFIRIESQVDDLIGRLFNFPRVAQSDEKAARPPSTSERILELRSRAIRVNEALATLLEKL